MKEYIKKYLILLIGIIIFTYNFFKFIITIIKPSSLFPYSGLTNILIYLVIGIVLMVFWFTKIKETKK